MWYALVQDEQLGPMSARELGDLMTQGVINAETFIWREGMPEWQPLRAVPEFQEITVGAVADLGLYDYANEGDEEDGEGATLMLDADAAADWSEYIDQVTGDAPPMTSEPPGDVVPQPASQPPVDPVAATEAIQSPFDPNAPAPDGLRSAFDEADEPHGRLPLPSPDENFSAPNLSAPPEFGADFSSPPVPAPTAPEPQGGGAGKTVLLFVLLLLLGGGGAALFMYLRATNDTPEIGRDQPETIASSQPPSEAPPPPPPKDAAKPPPPKDAAVPDAAPALAPDAAVPDAAVDAAPADAMVLTAIDIADEPDAGRSKAKPKLTAEQIAKRKAAREKRLAAMKAAEEKKRRARERAKQSNLPKALGRADIEGVVKANADKFSACASKDAKAKGHATVAVTIDRNGSVKRAKVVTARLRRSPAGACVESAMKGLKFPRFSGDPMRINLPLKL